MLKGIHPALSPDLLKILCEMGHGDEIVLADAHFPAHSCGVRHVLRADGVQVTDLLAGIVPLFELDSYADPLHMMAPAAGDALDPQVEAGFLAVIRRTVPAAPAPIRLDRKAFYERTKGAHACVVSGTMAKYANIILKKGVTPVPGA